MKKPTAKIDFATATYEEIDQYGMELLVFGAEELSTILRGVGTVPPGYNARTTPILGSMVSPPCSTTSISASITARHANVSCSRFGKPAM